MREYRIMFNRYDGKGDRSCTPPTYDYNIALALLESIRKDIVKLKGKAWIEVRDVSKWHQVED